MEVIVNPNRGIGPKYVFRRTECGYIFVTICDKEYQVGSKIGSIFGNMKSFSGDYSQFKSFCYRWAKAHSDELLKYSKEFEKFYNSGFELT